MVFVVTSKLSLPIPLRYLLASHPEMMGPVLEVVNRAISSFLINKAGVCCEFVYHAAIGV